MTEIAALKIEFVYVNKEGWLNEVYTGSNTALLSVNDQCSQEQQTECCSADKINQMTGEEYEKYKRYCNDLGCQICPKSKAGKNKKHVRHLHDEPVQRDLMAIADNLTDTTLHDTIGEYTDLNVVSAGAVLNATDLKSITLCAAGRHNYTEYWGGWFIKCEEYDNAQCEINDYMKVRANRVNFCLDLSPTASPRPSSSPYPTWKWTPFPGSPFPSWSPYPPPNPTLSSQPSKSPYPTHSPSVTASPTVTSSPSSPRSCYYKGRQTSEYPY